MCRHPDYSFCILRFNLKKDENPISKGCLKHTHTHTTRLLTCEAVQRGPSDVTRSHSRAGCGKGALGGKRAHDSLQQEGLSCSWRRHLNQRQTSEQHNKIYVKDASCKATVVHACTPCEEDISAREHGAEDGGLLSVQLPDGQRQDGLFIWVGLHLKPSKTSD